MTRVLVYAIPVVLAVWALVDLWQTARPNVRLMPKFFWAVGILGIPVIGPILWLAAGRRRERGRGPGGAPRPSRPVAPDDDPDFLRELDAKRLRDKRDESGHRDASDGDVKDPSE